MIRPSASSVERQLACPGSAHLPHAPYETAAAAAGVARHEDAEVSALIGDLEGLPWQVRKLLEPGDVFATECAMAYDVSDDTARALGHIAWRDYRDLRPFEIPMTIDLIVHGDRRSLVVDYKGFEPVTSADRNAQLATGALALARASGRSEIDVAIVYLGASWRPADVATLSAFDLDVHAARLRDMMSSTDRTVRVGPWCKYCHAFAACPDQRALAEQAGGGDLVMRVETMIPFDRDEDARAAYELRGRIKLLLQRLDAALHARAAERPIPLEGGRMFGRVTSLGNERLDGDVVYQIVLAEHGQEVADAVVTRSATKKRLEEVLKRAGAKKVLEAVRAAGGATRKETTSIEEYDPTPRLVDAP